MTTFLFARICFWQRQQLFSGAVAERIQNKRGIYDFLRLYMSELVYPIVGSWQWEVDF